MWKVPIFVSLLNPGGYGQVGVTREGREEVSASPSPNPPARPAKDEAMD